VDPSIVHQALDDVQKAFVEGGFAAQDADSLPGDLSIDATGDEGLYGRNGHFNLAGRLAAGPVAVDAFQVAFVGDIDLDKLATWQILPAETVGNP
jgi:hypothetical protein